MRIVLALNSLFGPGGAERVISIMANHWAEKGWFVSIVTFDDGERPPYYPLHPRINHMMLNQKSKNENIWLRIRDFLSINVETRKRLVEEKPDIIIAFTSSTGLKVLRALLGRKIPVIVSERNMYTKSTRSMTHKCYRNLLYLKAKTIVCQTQTKKATFPPLLQRKSVIIPNPVPGKSSQVVQPEVTLPAGKIVFAVGHLSHEKIYQKGLDLLIPVFGKVSEKNADWHLVILNDGPEKDMLVRIIERCNLQGRVHFPGPVKDIYSVFSHGEMFVLSSRYEGFPNALCEAMACGLPAVSFDCPSGPGDIVRHGIDGLLVPPEDQEGLSKALDYLMSDENLRRNMGEKAREITIRFNEKAVMNKWEELIAAALLKQESSLS